MKRIFEIVLSLLTLCSVQAQERIGLVTNLEGNPVDMATVVLFAGEKQVAATVTDTTGRFIISVADGEYIIKVRNIMYKPLEQRINIQLQTDTLGFFKLEESLVNLDEVVVSAPTLTRKADRFVMRINTPFMLNKDASEVLRLAPGVWIDNSGVSINGMKGVKVFINERELKLKEQDLVAYLRSMRSSDISRVEVIPLAGSEYSADSRGGVIKIILRKQTENGLNGNVMVKTLKGIDVSSDSPSGSANAHMGKWTFNAFASGNFMCKGKSKMNSTRVYSEDDGADFYSQSETNKKQNDGIGRLGVVYQADKRNNIGAEVEYSLKERRMPSLSETVNEQKGIAINTISNYNQREDNKNMTIAFNYTHKIDTLGSVLKFVSDYTDKKVTGNNDYHSIYEMPNMVVDSIYRNNTLSKYKVFSADMMLSKKINERLKFSTGAKYTRNDMYDTTRYRSYYLSDWKTLDDYSFSLRYRENIVAFYGTFAAELHRLSFSAGLRGEYTFINDRKNDSRKSYFDIFPNANITYSFNAMRTFMLIGQYSRNIERPNFWYLNPNRVQYSEYSYMTGNPDLNAVYIHRLNLTAVYKYRYTLTIGGNLHRNLIREVCKIDPFNEDITYITPENHYLENHYFIALNIPLQPTDYLSVNANLVGVKQDIQLTKDDDKASHYLYFANLTTNITLPADFYFEISYNGVSRLYSGNAGVNPRQLFHASLKKQFLEGRLTASLGMNNIFNSKASYFSNTERFTINTSGREPHSSRYIKLGLQYNFKSGKSFKAKKIKYASEEEQKRLKKQNN